MSHTRSWRAHAGLALAWATALWLFPAAVGAEQADSLYQRGRELARSSDLQLRLQAARDLEEAARLAPERADVWRELSELQASLRQRQQARRSLERLAALMPDDAGAWTRLGDAWRWDWLATIDDSSFARALRCYRRATGLDSAQLAAWLGRAGMLLAKGDLRGSRAAAEGAVACAPSAAMSQLTFACVAYRAGALELAEGAFDVAIPRLPAEFVPRFHGIAATQERGPARAPADDDSTIVWGAHTVIPDPDRTTEWNEAALDYQFRVGLALLLLRSEDSLRWDMRSELIARYGMPAQIHEANPDQPLEFSFLTGGAVEWAPGGSTSVGGGRSGPTFPFHFQLWRYPALGMDVPLWDRSLTERYESPPNLDESTDPLPDYRRLRGRSDLVLSPDGLAVFRAMAPGVTPIPVSVLVSRFPAAAGARLVAHVATAAGPRDTLWATMVVTDRDGHRVAVADGAMKRAVCDPTGRQLAQLAGVVPPGEYRVDVSVRFGVRQRGLARRRAQVVQPDAGVRMGDVVLLCGPIDLQTSGGAIQLEPEFGRRTFPRRDLAVYFELSNLVLAGDGRRSFRYAYAIHALDGDGGETGPALVEASRVESYAGDDRRQFISAKTGGLRPGRYRLRIDIRDEIGGAEASRAVDFEQVAAAQ